MPVQTVLIVEQRIKYAKGSMNFKQRVIWYRYNTTHFLFTVIVTFGVYCLPHIGRCMSNYRWLLLGLYMT